MAKPAKKSMPVNPWHGFRPVDGTFVHPDDTKYVEAFNRLVNADAPERLVTSAWPQPWAGPINNASIVVLTANPGWSDGDEEAEHQLSPLLEANLSGDRPLFWLDPAAASTPGAAWVRERLLAKVLAEIDDEVVAAALCMAEFFPYHSKRWGRPPITLPTQWYTFDLVRARLAEGATVIITRAAKDWKIAVPELIDHPRVFTTNSVQNTRLSPNNLSAGGWEQLIERLHAVARIGFERLT